MFLSPSLCPSPLHPLEIDGKHPRVTITMKETTRTLPFPSALGFDPREEQRTPRSGRGHVPQGGGPVPRGVSAQGAPRGPHPGGLGGVPAGDGPDPPLPGPGLRGALRAAGRLRQVPRPGSHGSETPRLGSRGPGPPGSARAEDGPRGPQPGADRALRAPQSRRRSGGSSCGRRSASARRAGTTGTACTWCAGSRAAGAWSSCRASCGPATPPSGCSRRRSWCSR